jgi:molybdopterin-guanine dinucleotide biosynthesis protein A
MGKDKSQLQIGEVSLLQQGLNLLEVVGSDLILLSGDEGKPLSVPDILPQCGPPGGLYACLEHLSNIGKLDDSPLLIIPVDMPKLDADVITTLLNSMPGQQACHFKGEVFPCVVRASESLRENLQQLFSESHELGGKRSMRAVLEFCNSKQISKALFTEEVFRNINTPEDYEKALLNT